MLAATLFVDEKRTSWFLVTVGYINIQQESAAGSCGLPERVWINTLDYLFRLASALVNLCHPLTPPPQPFSFSLPLTSACTSLGPWVNKKNSKSSVLCVSIGWQGSQNRKKNRQASASSTGWITRLFFSISIFSFYFYFLLKCSQRKLVPTNFTHTLKFHYSKLSQLVSCHYVSNLC